MRRFAVAINDPGVESGVVVELIKAKNRLVAFQAHSSYREDRWWDYLVDITAEIFEALAGGSYLDRSFDIKEIGCGT